MASSWSGSDDLCHEADRESLLGLHPTTAHDDVLRPAHADEAGESLRAARAGDHPDRRLRERHLHVVGCDPEITRERELEADAEDVALELCDDGLRASLGCRDVLRELGDDPGGLRQESGNVASGRELAARAREDDEPHRIVAVEVGKQRRKLVAREHRDPVELPGHVQREVGTPRVGVSGRPETVVFGSRRSPSARFVGLCGGSSLMGSSEAPTPTGTLAVA